MKITVNGGWRRYLFLLIAFLLVGSAFGLGECWRARPPATPPPVATLTNEARYIAWKFREDVTDPSTGLGTVALCAKADALRKQLEPKEDWRVVKAKCFALLCDEMAIDVSPLDWYPAIAIWNRYGRPLDYFKGGRLQQMASKYYPDEWKHLQAGNRTGKWMMWVDFDHSVPVWEELITDGFTGALANVRKHDEKYENLQVRVCGWNVRWNDIPKSEQDEYILRAERILQ